jgi:hypothetical protein
MPSLSDLVATIDRRIALGLAKRSGKFEVATTSPFEVYLDGSATAVPARKVAGLTYSVGTTGDYLLRQGQTPLCIPTV